MLFPAKMAEVEILVHDSVKYDVLHAMQRRGFIHVVHHGINLAADAAPSSYVGKIVDFSFRISKLMSILDIARKKGEGGLKELLNPPAPERYEAMPRGRDEIIHDAVETLQRIEKEILSLGAEWEKLNNEIERKKKQLREADMLQGLDFDLSHLGEGPYVAVYAGMAKDISQLLKLFQEGKVALWYTSMGKRKSITHIIVVAYHLKDRKDVESALRFSSFSEFELQGLRGKPVEAIASLKKEISSLEARRKEHIERIARARKRYYAHLSVLYDDLENEKIKEDYHSRFGKTEATTVIRGYIPKKRLDEAVKEIKKASKGLAVVRWKDAEGDDTPVVFNNPKFLRPFQAFVEMYSTPKYGYIEPTVIIAPLFIAYFGLTLGDAGYGFIIALLGYLLWQRIGKYDWTNRTLGKILFISGISAIIFGIIQGSIFGPLDSNNPISQYIQYEPLLDPMKNAVYLLTIALIVGIAQISLGLILGAYHHIKYKNYGDFLTSELSWFLLLPSGGLLIGHMFDWWSVEPQIVTLSWIVLAIGLVLLSGVPGHLLNRDSAINAMAFFDITGMVGDWLSYSRLLALDLGTSGIALTINLFAGIMFTMIVGAGSLVCCMPLLVIGVALFAMVARKRDRNKTGIALFLLILGAIGLVNIQAALWLFIGIYLVAAHIGNALLQSLGSLVHSLRLQYVEFFSKFYEGDGVKFEPFREIRKYSRIVDTGGVKK
ncbi:ATPase [Euryarchaeota archaeon ex4484_178]|nr:MAG: ATPase [Euryarchaeota archaeon ex4484_178]